MSGSTDVVIAWDTHAHVIGDPREFPLAPGRGYTPAPASLESYLAMLDRHHIARGVLVQPSIYGHDHRCLFDALDRADGRLRGIAVPAPDATVRNLEDMHARGIRGVRCNLINPGGLAPSIVNAWQPAMRSMGWHVEFQIAIDVMAEWTEVVRLFDIPVVIDHMGRPTPGRVDPHLPALGALVQLVTDGRCYVKLSAPYRVSGVSAPWRDVAALAQALLDANASACLWGSDWPHVDTHTPVNSDDVVAAFDAWCGERGHRRDVTRDAAHRLFG